MIVVVMFDPKFGPRASYYHYPGSNCAISVSRNTPWVKVITPTGRIETLEDLLCLLHEFGHHNRITVEKRYTEEELRYLMFNDGSRERVIEEIEAWKYALRCIKEDAYDKAWLVIYERLKSYEIDKHFSLAVVREYVEGKTDTM